MTMTIADNNREELRDELRTSARAMLTEHSSPKHVRALAGTGQGFDADLWTRFAVQGWPGIEVAEEFGGAAGSFGDIAVVLVEMGRALCSNGFAATAVLALGPLLRARHQSPASQWLPALAEGRGRATAVVAGAGNGHLMASERGDGWVVSGTAACVPDAVGADLLILPATTENGREVVFAVAPAARGLGWTDAPMLDITRRFADLHAVGVKVCDNDVLAEGDSATGMVVDLLDRAALATACDAFGVAERALEMTTAYVKERVQFGRAIGSFQAIKHRCADMFIAVETARASLEEALDAYDAAPASASALVSRAKAYCCDTAAQVTEDAVELHGGIGFTWEHDMHLYVKRARLDQALYGDSRWHRRRVAAITLDRALVDSRRTENSFHNLNLGVQ